MPDRDYILAAVDRTLAEAGRTAMRVCLSAEARDSVTIVTDEVGRPVAASLLAAALEIGSEARAFVVERRGTRPVSRFAPDTMAAVGASTVTALCMTPVAGEWRARAQLIETVRERSIRHAHLMSVAPETMRDGMRADYHAVDRLQARVLEHLGPDSRVRVTSSLGTDCEVTFTAAHQWVRANGLIAPGTWQNLPSGEIWTCPDSVEGSYVADKLITDWFHQKYGDLGGYPVTLEIAGGRVRNVRSDNATLARELLLFIRSSENGDRVGEFGIGTNRWLSFGPGVAGFADKVPGAHVSLGDPLGTDTGAAWTSKTRVSLVGTGMSVVANGVPILKHGVFVPDMLEGL